MNLLDLLILVGLTGGLIIGLRSGLIKQVLSFAGMLVAFVLSLHLMTPVGEMAAGSLGISEDIAPLVGFVLVFLGDGQIHLFGEMRLAAVPFGDLFVLDGGAYQTDGAQTHGVSRLHRLLEVFGELIVEAHKCNRR